MRRRALKTLALAVGVYLTLATATSAATRGIDINKKTYPVTGIDVSQYCGEIDFKKVVNNKKTDIDFIYMRASLGKGTTDTQFETYYKDAKKHNVPIGVYHFFKFKDGGTVQAQNFLNAIKNKEFELPLVIDIEEWGNKGKWNPTTIITNIRAFIKTVRKHRNEDIIIYSNRNTYNKYIREYFPKEKLWICSFKDPDEFSIKWQFWQHSHMGRVSGIDHDIDINTFNGNKEEWAAFLKEFKDLKEKKKKERNR